MQQSRFYNKLCEIVKLALTYLLIVRPNVTWTSAIRVFLTHLNTVQADTETESETDACLCHVRLCVLIKWTTRQWLNRQPCTTHFLWVQRSLLWAWSRAQPERLSSRPPPHRSLTNHCHHQPPPVNAIWRFKLGRALWQSTVQLLLKPVVNECVPRYGRRNLQGAFPGRKPEKRRISSGLTSPWNIEQDIITVQ